MKVYYYRNKKYDISPYLKTWDFGTETCGWIDTFNTKLYCNISAINAQ